MHIFERGRGKFGAFFGMVRRPQGDKQVTVRRISPRITYLLPTPSPRFSEKYTFLTHTVNKFYRGLVTRQKISTFEGDLNPFQNQVHTRHKLL